MMISNTDSYNHVWMSTKPAEGNHTFLTCSMNSFLSPAYFVVEGPLSSLLALTRSAWSEDRQRANTDSPGEGNKNMVIEGERVGFESWQWKIKLVTLHLCNTKHEKVSNIHHVVTSLRKTKKSKDSIPQLELKPLPSSHCWDVLRTELTEKCFPFVRKHQLLW